MNAAKRLFDAISRIEAKYEEEDESQDVPGLSEKAISESNEDYSVIDQILDLMTHLDIEEEYFN